MKITSYICDICGEKCDCTEFALPSINDNSNYYDRIDFYIVKKCHLCNSCREAIEDLATSRMPQNLLLGKQRW